MRTERVLARTALLAALVFAIAEALVRLLGTSDVEGQFRLLGTPLPPLRIPLRQIAESVERFSAASDSLLAYDPLLGWTPRPGSGSRDGLARVNAAGIRRDTEIGVGAAAVGPLVEAFGDSFTFGDESPVKETWPFLLERRLAASGFDTPVLNFGVNAYGIDQAYLRWKHAGRAYRPSVVILGFQPENLVRNLNLFRPLHFAATEVPLSKPRFALAGDRLELVNSPALPPERIVPTLAGLAQSPLRAHERLYDRRYEDRWWLRSKLLALVAGVIDPLYPAGGDPVVELGSDPEAQEVGRRLLERFAAEVRVEGAAFLVVDLPRQGDLGHAERGTPDWAEPVLLDVAGEAPVVRPGPSFLPLEEGDFRPKGHYGRRLNRLVADALVAPVSEALCAREPAAKRPAACAR